MSARRPGMARLRRARLRAALLVVLVWLLALGTPPVAARSPYATRKDPSLGPGDTPSNHRRVGFLDSYARKAIRSEPIVEQLRELRRQSKADDYVDPLSDVLLTGGAAQNDPNGEEGALLAGGAWPAVRTRLWCSWRSEPCRRRPAWSGLTPVTRRIASCWATCTSTAPTSSATMEPSRTASSNATRPVLQRGRTLWLG